MITPSDTWLLSPEKKKRSTTSGTFRGSSASWSSSSKKSSSNKSVYDEELSLADALEMRYSLLHGTTKRDSVMAPKSNLPQKRSRKKEAKSAKTSKKKKAKLSINSKRSLVPGSPARRSFLSSSPQKCTPKKKSRPMPSKSMDENIEIEGKAYYASPRAYRIRISRLSPSNTTLAFRTINGAVKSKSQHKKLQHRKFFNRKPEKDVLRFILGGTKKTETEKPNQNLSKNDVKLSGSVKHGRIRKDQFHKDKLSQRKYMSKDSNTKYIERSEVQKSNNNVLSATTCNCKKSKCLKLYCQCFSSENFCGSSCKCASCHNTAMHIADRQVVIDAIVSRNPLAFKKKSSNGEGKATHMRGCQCRKSGCKKKYCVCFGSGMECSDICKCQDCYNGKPVAQLKQPESATGSYNQKDAAFDNKKLNSNQLELAKIASAPVHKVIKQVSTTSASTPPLNVMMSRVAQLGKLRTSAEV